MNVNEETAALITELRSWTVDDAPNSIVSLMHRSADHLAALTTPQEGDALEARQPSEDDREATEAEIDKSARALHMAKCCSLSGDSPHDFPEASEVFAAGVVLNAVPRAAVPDAATEIDRESLVESIAGGTISIPGGFGELSRDDAESIIDAILPAINEWRNTRKTA